MKINITNKEYRTLLEVLEIADWVMHGHRTDDPKDRERYREFEQKIFSLAEEFGCDDLVELDQKSGRYYPTRQYEDTSPAMSFIEEFVNESLWYELTERLVQRDLMRELEENTLQSLSLEERFAKEEPYEKKYDEEFQAHGLDRLEVVSGPRDAFSA